ncbi:MAG: hypothetical protein AAF351_01215 [Pseudomonadota bacterium]
MNKRISKVPAFFKWLLPIFVIGVFVGVMVMMLTADNVAWPMIAAIGMAGIIAALVFKKFVWDLVDEVYDGGDHLVFRDRGIEQKVALRDIQNIGYVGYTSPRRVTVTCRNSGKLGKELVFMPPVRVSLNPFSTPAMVTDLIERVDAARDAP